MSKQALEQGPYMLNYRFARTRPSHFANITAGGLYTEYIDLTGLFEVPEADSYSVTMGLQTPAFLRSGNSTLEQALSHSIKPANLQSLCIYSSPLTMPLAKSESDSMISKQQDGPKRGFPGDCFGEGSSDSESIVRAAYLEANKLAKYAQGSTNGDLCKLYFNAPGQQGAVYNAYQGVLNHRKHEVAGMGTSVIREQCDPNNTDPICLDDDEPAACG